MTVADLLSMFPVNGQIYYFVWSANRHEWVWQGAEKELPAETRLDYYDYKIKDIYGILVNYEPYIGIELIKE